MKKDLYPIVQDFNQSMSAEIGLDCVLLKYSSNSFYEEIQLQEVVLYNQNHLCYDSKNDKKRGCAKGDCERTVPEQVIYELKEYKRDLEKTINYLEEKVK